MPNGFQSGSVEFQIQIRFNYRAWIRTMNNASKGRSSHVGNTREINSELMTYWTFTGPISTADSGGQRH
jgi:hypothetical protein